MAYQTYKLRVLVEETTYIHEDTTHNDICSLSRDMGDDRQAALAEFERLLRATQAATGGWEQEEERVPPPLSELMKAQTAVGGRKGRRHDE